MIFKDVYDKNITIYYMPHGKMWKQVMSNLHPPYPELSEQRFYIPNSWEEFNNLTKYHLLEKESVSFNNLCLCKDKIILGYSHIDDWKFDATRL